MTNIYLMKDAPTGFYKIGRSIDPLKRERTLLAQAPQIELVAYWADCPDTLESFVHTEFRQYRKRGEWFLLDDPQIFELYWLMMDFNRYDVTECALPLDIEILKQHNLRYLLGAPDEYFQRAFLTSAKIRTLVQQRRLARRGVRAHIRERRRKQVK